LISKDINYNNKLEDEVKKQLLELREKDKLIIAQSKLAAVGETLSHIAHQWKQPLSQINSVLVNIEANFEKKSLTKDILNEHLNEIEQLTFYMADTIETFNKYLQPNDKKETFSIKEAFNDSFKLVENLLESKEIKCFIDIDENLNAQGIQKEFVQALLVILNNAKDVLVEKDISEKRIYISIYEREGKSIVEIMDNAGGISDEYFDKIFDPYFTTKPHSQGTGHGLCMAKLIIEKTMHGKLLASNEKNGAMFSIILESEF